MAPQKTSKAVAAGRAALLFSTLVSFIVCQLLEVRISNSATSELRWKEIILSSTYSYMAPSAAWL